MLHALEAGTGARGWVCANFTSVHPVAAGATSLAVASCEGASANARNAARAPSALAVTPASSSLIRSSP